MTKDEFDRMVVDAGTEVVNHIISGLKTLGLRAGTVAEYNATIDSFCECITRHMQPLMDEIERQDKAINAISDVYREWREAAEKGFGEIGRLRGVLADIDAPYGDLAPAAKREIAILQEQLAVKDAEIERLHIALALVVDEDLCPIGIMPTPLVKSLRNFLSTGEDIEFDRNAWEEKLEKQFKAHMLSREDKS